ncbi:hypothetical protein AB6A40_009247 [Gnathostoma spinigerum]|uniref:Reverse transcriptase domain-containing protein n=1 Tax=Gnathostoma spinigerum TaxID=75299 RepID=A0ABD6ERF8_9BILA
MSGRIIPSDTKRGVRQRDTKSPQLFNACLQIVFERLNWQRKGIDEKLLSNFRFANDIVLISRSYNQLRTMLKDLVRDGNKVESKTNVAKTKVMTNRNIGRSFTVNQKTAEKVDEFIYLGQLITINKDTETEVRRRIKIGWKSFFNSKEFFTDRKVGMILRRRLFNPCVLPAMLYGSETWTVTKKIEMMMQVAQRRMERMMARVTLRDRKTNEWLRGVTKVKDFVKCARKTKI